MEYKGEGVEALVAVMEEIQGANLIMVDKKIKSLLKCLAFYDEFRAVLAYCNQNFDYQSEKKRALAKVGEHYNFRLPKNVKSIVALVSNLLVEFDSGVMDYVGFTGDYFPSQNKQESADACYCAMLEPFKLALVGLVVEGIEEDVPVQERTVEFAANGLQQQTEYLLVAIVNAVQEANIGDSIRDDLMIMLEGFAAALDSRDSLMIKAVWLGIKKALNSLKLCAREIEKVDELLKLYLVVK